MAALTRNDLESALEAAGEWHRAATLDDLESSVLRTLRRLIPCARIAWNEVDVAARRVRYITSPTETVANLERLERLIHQNPLVDYAARTGDRSPTKFSDHLTAREYHRLELYQDYYRDIATEDQLGVAVEIGSRMIGVTFSRDRRSFTERDRTVLTLLQTHLVAAYSNVLDRLEAARRFALLTRGLDGREVVPLDAHGRLDHASRLLERWFGAVPTRLQPGTYERDDSRLVVRRVDGDPPVLLLEERRLTPDPGRVRAFGLTRREAEILGLVARGLTDVEIADRLVVSRRTVEKHLEHAYEKLGVHSRTDAAQALLAR